MYLAFSGLSKKNEKMAVLVQELWFESQHQEQHRYGRNRMDGVWSNPHPHRSLEQKRISSCRSSLGWLELRQRIHP